MVVHGQTQTSSAERLPATSVDEPQPSTSSDEIVAPAADRPREAESLVQNVGSGSGPARESVALSPAFRSAAAMAGWDAEALLQAALNQSPLPSRGSDISTTQDESAISCVVGKRDKRTPLSSARRHRRVRWEGNNGTPLGRVPMKPLTLLTDDEEDSNSSKEKNDERDCAEARVKEKVESKPTILIKGNDSKGKETENSQSKPPCLDQLREELSCAVCLDICFEPSTISCGHSFCGTCLRSVLQNCGPRCPKCRQSLRSESLRNCKINTVLWNTIQILFPEESAARSQDQQRQRDEMTSQKTLTDESRSRSLGTRPARLQPWRRSNLSEFTRTVNFGSSFQTAAEFMSSSERNEAGASRQESPSARITREGIERRRIERSERQTQEASRHAQSRTRRQVRATQEQIDAALAARLQQAELNAGSDVEVIVGGSTRRAASHGHRRSSRDSSAFSSAYFQSARAR